MVVVKVEVEVEGVVITVEMITVMVLVEGVVMTVEMITVMVLLMQLTGEMMILAKERTELVGMEVVGM